MLHGEVPDLEGMLKAVTVQGQQLSYGSSIWPLI